MSAGTTPRSWPGKILDALGSLKLTVALLGMSIFLVFAGTLAQRFQGIWTVMEQYFRCPVAWVDLKIFYPADKPVSWSFPFPGGFLIGGTLVVNLLVSHLRRIRLQARGKRLVVGAIVLANGLLLSWLTIAYVFATDSTQKIQDPTWRVSFQLLVALGVALVLFLACYLLFARKAGIVLLHGGVLLMMLSEVVTHFMAEEAHMTLSEGDVSNSVQDQREAELAVVDPSDPAHDKVVAVPQKLLKRGGPVVLPGLPFDLEVAANGFMGNANLKNASPGEPNPATAGEGLTTVAKLLPEATMEEVDIPAAYVALRGKSGGASLGTWLFALGMEPQRVEAGGRAFDVQLRFKRIYKPYKVYLEDFNATFYPGTETPKDFSAFVRLVDEERKVDRPVRIWMNNPLRYRGDTLYQSGWDPRTGNTTTLQVVANAGWMVPYLGCMIVAVGLFGQFFLHLLGFLRGRRDAA